MNTKLHSKFTAILFFFAVSLFFSSCNNNSESSDGHEKSDKKIGLLLVNHGSRSETWRNALVDLEKNVSSRILASGEIKGIKTAFMEYTEPSIATRLKEFDDEGYSDIIVVPIFLTVSSHTFDDIPTIMGQKTDPQSKESFKLENIKIYKPKANTYLAPNLDFTDILKKNVARRAKAMSKNPASEGVVLIGYGDAQYDKEWTELFNEVGDYVKKELGITEHSYGWCGHLVHYDSQKTTDAINEILAKKETAIVIPVLVAHDEEFQNNIIGGGVKKVKNHKDKVYYKTDAILPDKNIEQWVIDITADYLKKVESSSN
ncbi:MAG: CbiX/SirB N-terminal domain-containing protein [Crocinitomicaceae bacterium]|nr:CbiX/SirB N-terminal domain-containing protein [Crocinitomicaceae bacterium]